MRTTPPPLFATIFRSALFLALALLSALASAAHAKGPKASRGVEGVIKILKNAKIESVVVFDFPGPDVSIAPVGRELAAELRSDMAKAAPYLKISTAAETNAALDRRNSLAALASAPASSPAWSRLPLTDPADATLLAQSLQSQAFILGFISIADKLVILDIECYRANPQQDLGSFEIKLPLSAQIQALLQQPMGNHSATYPRGGKEGYSNPACLYCPPPVFTSEAVQNGVQGVVHLLTVIDSNGRVQIFSVQQGLPYGLTLAAIRAVRTWRLRPATGPDGKPAAVQVPIEVSFHFFR